MLENYITKLPNHYQTKDGASLGYFTAGNRRKPVIFLHNGLSCNPVIYLPVIQRFKKDFFFVYIADRGHMDSTMGGVGTDDISIEVLARDCKALMDHLKIKRAVHMGFSMGVQVIFQMYKLFPETCQGFIVMGGTAGRIFQGRPGHKAVEMMLIPFLEKVVKDYEKIITDTWQKSNIFDIIGLSFRLVREDGPRMNKAELKYLFRHFSSFNPKTFLAYGKALTEQDARMVVPEVDLPTIIFGGTQDIFVPHSFQEKLHHKIPHSKLVTFENASHLFPLSYQKEILSELETFFGEHAFKKGLFG